MFLVSPDMTNTMKYETHLLYVFQSNEWSKNDERLLSAVEHGEMEKVSSLLAKKGASATKLDGEGKSA